MPIKVLFLCQSNATLSILAEALLNDMGKGEFQASSAGSCPTAVHPLTVAVLQENYIKTGQLQSKPVSLFDGQTFDYVIALTDGAADEELKSASGRLGQFRWTFSDPARAVVKDGDRLTAFRHVVLDLRQRLSLFMIVTRREALAGFAPAAA
jgi:protein-tyrosine-phosphatase